MRIILKELYTLLFSNVLRLEIRNTKGNVLLLFSNVLRPEIRNTKGNVFHTVLQRHLELSEH